MFANIVHFSLDIRDNKFESIAPAILYGNKSNWEQTGTKALQGELSKKEKLSVQGNLSLDNVLDQNQIRSNVAAF